MIDPCQPDGGPGDPRPENISDPQNSVSSHLIEQNSQGTVALARPTFNFQPSTCNLQLATCSRSRAAPASPVTSIKVTRSKKGKSHSNNTMNVILMRILQGRFTTSAPGSWWCVR